MQTVEILGQGVAECKSLIVFRFSPFRNSSLQKDNKPKPPIHVLSAAAPPWGLVECAVTRAGLEEGPAVFPTNNGTVPQSESFPEISSPEQATFTLLSP